MRSLSSLTVVAALAAAAAVGVAVAPPAPAAVPAAVPTATRAAGTYVPVTPFRAVDTRTGAKGNHKGAVPFNHGISPAIGGHGAVPSSGVAAVAVTITAVSPTAAGGLVAYAAGTSRPAVNNVLYPKGHNVAVFAIVRTSSSGRISMWNVARSGSTQIVVDVSGYYVAGRPSEHDPGVLHTVTPARVLGTHTIAGGRTLTATIGGHAHVPASNVGTVAMMITATSRTRSGALTVYPAGSARPSQATVHFAAGVGYTAFATVPLDDKGRITIYNNSSGAVSVAVDIAGYTVGGVPTTAGTMLPLRPTRLVNGSRIPPHTSRSVPVAAHAGVPLHGASAVLVTISVAAPTRTGGIIAWPAGTAPPGVTNVQFAPGQTTSDVAVVPVSSSGAIGVHNTSSGPVQLYVDVHGYVPATALRPPPPSRSRYLGDLTENVPNDEAKMQTHGCDDAAAGSTFVLLDVGAQSITGPELSKDRPGVAIALATPTVRLHYDDLVTVIDTYLTSFGICLPSDLTATIAVGTNNSGAYSGPTAYAADVRGTAWATQVVTALATNAPARVSVVGANDIENGDPDTDGFDNDVTNAQRWETAYLAATDKDLVYNGSANGCPTTFGARGGTCGDGWTEEEFYGLAHSGNRISVLPQVYVEEQAVQWANINATGDATGKGGLIFAGSLTQHAVDPTTFTAKEGWAALVRALTTVVSTPVVPAATDITNG